MTPSILQTLIAAAVMMTCMVFVVAFRKAQRAANASEHGAAAELPRAALVTVQTPRPRIGLKPWLIARMPAIQAGMVAAGITGIFIMVVCMAGVLGMAIFAMG